MPRLNQLRKRALRVLVPLTGLLRTAAMRANIAPVASITGAVRRPRARIHKDK
jgi:hypothetical protein